VICVAFHVHLESLVFSMDSNRYVRSRTSSTSSLPATPAHTPNIVTINRSTPHGVFQSFQQVELPIKRPAFRFLTYLMFENSRFILSQCRRIY